MGFIGGAIRAFGGNGVSVVDKVKSKPLQGQLDDALTQYQGINSSGQAALGDYISKYFANAGNVARYGAEESGAVNDFYNGNVANRLAALRQQRKDAVLGAADTAGRQAIRNSNLSRLNGEGGGSSYDQRQLMGALIPIQTGAAMDDAAQARSDYGYETQGKLDMVGKRTAIDNATAGYNLVPEAVKRSMYGQNIGFLGNLLQADQLNHFYGLKQDANPIADFFDSADQGIMNAASIYSSVAGGMKRGGLVRINYVGGGKVRGPGTGTSDSVPAQLSDGEFVMPAAAVKMPGVLPMLEHIRQMALKDSTAPKKAGGKDGRHFDMGGMVGGDWSNAGFGGAWGPGMPESYDWSATTPQGSPISQPQQAPKQASPSKSSGGGGMSGQAMALQARVDRDLFAQWFPSSSTFGTQQAPAFVAPGAASMPWFAKQQDEQEVTA